MLWFLLSFLASTVLAIFAYAWTRNFVTRRLRYVDAVQSTLAPIVSGVVAFCITLPFVAFLPFHLIGMGTALTLGLAVGAGVASGAREVRHKLPGF